MTSLQKIFCVLFLLSLTTQAAWAKEPFCRRQMQELMLDFQAGADGFGQLYQSLHRLDACLQEEEGNNNAYVHVSLFLLERLLQDKWRGYYFGGRSADWLKAHLALQLDRLGDRQEAKFWLSRLEDQQLKTFDPEMASLIREIKTKPQAQRPANPPWLGVRLGELVPLGKGKMEQWAFARLRPQTNWEKASITLKDKTKTLQLPGGQSWTSQDENLRLAAICRSRSGLDWLVFSTHKGFSSHPFLSLVSYSETKKEFEEQILPQTKSLPHLLQCPSEATPSLALGQACSCQGLEDAANKARAEGESQP